MLSTERLIIRPFLESDYQDLHEYLSLKETYQYEPGEPISLEEARKLAFEGAKGTDFWAVTLKENKKLIGHVSFILMKPKHFLTWEIGYIFNPSYQNKGYATEASRAVIAYAFTKLGAHRIVGYCSLENIPSWRVLEKCGVQREGLLRKNVYFKVDEDWKPCWYDSYQYAILEEDYIKQKGKQT
jgi:RimJ/RimL family protein N-acetyltransferase